MLILGPVCAVYFGNDAFMCTISVAVWKDMGLKNIYSEGRVLYKCTWIRLSIMPHVYSWKIMRILALPLISYIYYHKCWYYVTTISYHLLHQNDSLSINIIAINNIISTSPLQLPHHCIIIIIMSHILSPSVIF